MKPDYRDTLCLAFEKALLPAPEPDQTWLVLNSHPLPRNILAGSTVLHEQGFRPVYLALKRGGLDVHPSLEAGVAADHAVVLAGRVREVNQTNIARASRAVGPGGIVIVAGDKTSGVHALRKWVSARQPIDDSYAKHHALCFWFRGGSERFVEAEGTRTGPVFSHGKADKGSALLVEHFSDRIGGKVADFGAGDGFLIRELLKRTSKLTSVDLMEAEWAALELARSGLRDETVPMGFHWIDIATELQKKPMDWVIMNPPFHHGLGGSRSADPEIGKQFIRQATSTLVTGGRLLMVANRTLPYEDTLGKCFRKVERLADRNGYKVFEAVK